MNPVAVEGHFCIGPGHPFLLIAGPCVLESEELALEIAHIVKKITGRLGMSCLFKASYDKANRTSLNSFRGPGISKGLAILARIKGEIGLPIIADVHDVEQIPAAAEVLDVIQIPAFLCRQTDLLVAAAKTGRVVNIKKGQFVSPWDMRHAVEKVRASGNSKVLLTERGVTFGYNNLVVDMRGFAIMRSLGCPVIFDATHSVQLPGGGDNCSAGDRRFVPILSRAAVAAGVDGLFLEVHPDPDKALCDGPNSLALHALEPLLAKVAKIHDIVTEDL